ncbi:ribonuclease E inhibitor RraB [Ferrimonas senticii]|uniref:ribonuclease E inhibitor RraB n=1 Tax=Ferrimonas senticii TaxID=394566 RepID=UPI00041D407B|nr:ribonuclease E inhibitor RraB [Ferrimonas senticii]
MMTAEQLKQEQQMETREIVQALLEDGSVADATYRIEHHFAAENFDALEKVAVDVYKAGFEVEDPEEIELDDGEIAFCFSAVIDHELSVERLDKDCDQLIDIAAKYKVLYDGWGTHFIDPEEQ